MQQAPDPCILTPDFLGSVCATVTDPCIFNSSRIHYIKTRLLLVIVKLRTCSQLKLSKGG